MEIEPDKIGVVIAFVFLVFAVVYVLTRKDVLDEQLDAMEKIEKATKLANDLNESLFKQMIDSSKVTDPRLESYVKTFDPNAVKVYGYQRDPTDDDVMTSEARPYNRDDVWINYSVHPPRLFKAASIGRTSALWVPLKPSLKTGEQNRSACNRPAKQRRHPYFIKRDKQNVRSISNNPAHIKSCIGHTQSGKAERKVHTCCQTGHKCYRPQSNGPSTFR